MELCPVVVAFLRLSFPPRRSAVCLRRQVRSAKPIVLRLFVKPKDRRSHPVIVDPFVSVALLRSSSPVAVVVPLPHHARGARS
uniref:Uncharacterized protein n=1 Tax=Oryza nivara TaxID=4536 RepID=A0A0E0I8V3_ORYNI